MSDVRMSVADIGLAERVAKEKETHEQLDSFFSDSFQPTIQPAGIPGCYYMRFGPELCFGVPKKLFEVPEAWVHEFTEQAVAITLEGVLGHKKRIAIILFSSLGDNHAVASFDHVITSLTTFSINCDKRGRITRVLRPENSWNSVRRMFRLRRRKLENMTPNERREFLWRVLDDCEREKLVF